MITIHECEVLQELDTGLCPHCHRYKPTFEVLVPIFDRPDEIVEGCRNCVEDVCEQFSQPDGPFDRTAVLS